jgi:Flp pilus assembly protein TadD
VSLRDLEHPVSKKALREAYAAQKFARANNLPRAIASLEKAVRIDPNYRDAHLNLGVQYARIGRLGDARGEFQKALDIGPPTAPVLVNLALIALATNQIHEAEKFGRQALELDPASTGGRKILQFAAAH